MAVIRPFRGLRYTASAGPLSALVAPPYDVLSAEERDAYAAKSPHNVVHLTLPEQLPDDRSKFVKYARSAARLTEWRNAGALGVESAPAFYRYEQRFTVPGVPGPAYDRTSLIALIKLEPYENGVVLPHEQTFPKHKEDRLRILEATRSHLECIYGLFEDDGGDAFRAISAAPVTLTAEVDSGDGVFHRLSPITDTATCAALANALAERKVWIADGHHRYETALTFRAQRGEADGLVAEDFMMMALSSMSDPGLVLLPTHRIVPKMPLHGEELMTRLATRFEVEKAPNERLLEALDATPATERTLAVALPGGTGLLLRLKNPAMANEWIATDDGDRLKQLDVSLLHHVVFGQLLGLSGLDFFSYTRDPQEALDSVGQGSDAAFLMNPPTVEDMRQIALGGEKMPQKSTYYYPKILSGLVLWSLGDFER